MFNPEYAEFMTAQWAELFIERVASHLCDRYQDFRHYPEKARALYLALYANDWDKRALLDAINIINMAWCELSYELHRKGN